MNLLQNEHYEHKFGVEKCKTPSYPAVKNTLAGVFLVYLGLYVIVFTRISLEELIYYQW
jgi:hypothetical protein